MCLVNIIQYLFGVFVTAICVYDLCQCVSVILVYYISDCLTRESLLFDLN